MLIDRMRLYTLRSRILKKYGIDLFNSHDLYNPDNEKWKPKQPASVRVPNGQFNRLLKIAYNLEAKKDKTLWSLYTASEETGLVRNTVRNYIKSGGYFDLPVAGKWKFVEKGQIEYLALILDVEKKKVKVLKKEKQATA